MHIHDWRRVGAIALIIGLIAILASCGGQVAATPEAEPAEEATDAPSDEDPGVNGPEEVEAGSEFEVSWTGPNGRGDFVTIVAEGATEWTNEPWFYTDSGNPGELVAPTEEGDYELWYVTEDREILARSPITVMPFEGALQASDEVEAGSEFEVAWEGPDGPGDFVTIVAEGTERWTNESWFYTANGNPGELVAPIEPGDYEIWYVTGADDETMASTPITVTELEVTLEAPDEVSAGEEFEVEWTGPDGPSDYITIVPEGSEEGTYLDYAYTNEGNPVTITAPDEPGDYEIWYASDRIEGTFESIPIVVN